MNSTSCESEGEGGPLQVCKLPAICLPTAKNLRRGISREDKRKGQKKETIRRSPSQYVITHPLSRRPAASKCYKTS